MEALIQEFRYKPRWTIILGCGLFFGAGAAFMGWKAATNDRGLILNGVIELSSYGATIFYWCIAGGGIAFVLVACALLYSRLMSDKRIALTPSGLIVPPPRGSREEAFIPFADVARLKLDEVQSERILTIYYSNTQFMLVSSWMPSKEDFDELSKIIHERVAEKGVQST